MCECGKAIHSSNGDIFCAAKLNPAWTKSEVRGTKYGVSSNGWINTDLFEGWFIEHFIERVVSARPLFLNSPVVCNHPEYSSHVSSTENTSVTGAEGNVTCDSSSHI